MNNCIFTGRVTRDIELKTVGKEGNVTIGNFSLAVNEGFGEKEKTSFFNLTAFGKSAESLNKYVNKGQKILVNCKASQQQYTDKNGSKHNDVNFVVVAWEFADGKASGGNKADQAKEQPKKSDAEALKDEGFMAIPETELQELPFD